METKLAPEMYDAAPAFGFRETMSRHTPEPMH